MNARNEDYIKTGIVASFSIIQNILDSDKDNEAKLDEISRITKKILVNTKGEENIADE